MKKHQEEEKSRARALSTKLGPSTYNPIQSDTFAAISADKTKV